MIRARVLEQHLLATVGGPARARVVALLAAVLALQGADTSTIGAVATQLEPGLSIGNTQLGLLVTVSDGVGALATLPLGALADRLDRSRLLTAGVATWALATFVGGAAVNYSMLLLARLALGVVVAVAGPTVASLAGDLFPPSARGRLYGFILAGELLGGGLGFLVSGNVSAALGWRWAFWLTGLLSLLVAGALYRYLPEPARGGASMIEEGAVRIAAATVHGRAPVVSRAATTSSSGTSSGGTSSGGTSSDESTPADEPARHASVLEIDIDTQHIRPHPEHVLTSDPAQHSLWWAVRYILSVRTNLVMVVASALGYSLYSGIRTFGVLFVQNRFHVGQSLATVLLIVLGAGAVVGVLSTGRLADVLIVRGRIAARPVVAGVSFLLTAAFFAPALTVDSLAVTTPLFFLAAAALGGSNPPLDAARLDLMPSRLWGRAEAVRTALRSLLEAGAPLLIGVLATRFGTPTSGVGAITDESSSGDGLSKALLVMLAPVVLAGLLLLIRARRTYARDVATALASDRAAARPPA